MKELLIIMVVHLSIILTATKAIAQEKPDAGKVTPTVELAAPERKNFNTGTSFSSATTSDRISKRVAKGSAQIINAEWTKEVKAYTVWFTLNGVQNSAFFTSRGNYQGTIRYYTEKELPAEVRHQVKNTYHDFAITGVKEVHKNGTTAYLVTISDQVTWKVIRVIDSEMEVWEAYSKG